MYTIYVDDQLLYSPLLANQGHAILSPKLTLELNKAGSLTFLLPPNNVQYDNIKKLKSVITVYQDNEEIFRGRVLHDTRDFHNRKDVYCEGELSFLLDSIHRPASYESGTTLYSIFKDIIEDHNWSVDKFKQFTPGIFQAPVDIDDSASTGSNTSNYDVRCGRSGCRNKSMNYEASDDGSTGTYTCPTCNAQFTLSSYGVPKNVTHTGYDMTYDGQHANYGSKYTYGTDNPEIVYVKYVKAAPEAQRTSTDYTNTLDRLNTLLIEPYGGYLRIRVVDGVRYLDYVQEYGETIDQTIEFGVNLLDISEYISADEVFTELIPLGSESTSGSAATPAYTAICGQCDEKMGCSTEESEPDENGNTTMTTRLYCQHCDESYTMSDFGVPHNERLNVNLTFSKYETIDGVEYAKYVFTEDMIVYRASGSAASSNNVITIESVTDLSSLPDGIAKVDDHLQDMTAVGLFGRITRVQKWEGVTDPYELMKLGVSYLSSGVEKAVTLTCKAVDLHYLNVNTERIKLGSYVRVISSPHNIDKEFLCSQITMDLANPDKNEYTLGVSYTTLTGTQSANTKVINNTADAIRSSSASNVALSNDVNKIKDHLSTSGETMTKASIFKLLTDNGKSQGMFMDETTGDIYFNASYIKSGTLILGGKNPLMQVVNSDGNVCVNVNESGIHILDGEINATSGTLENMSIVNGITISSKDGGVQKVPLISIEPYDDGTGKTLYQIVFGYDNSDPNKGNTTVVFDFDDVHLKNALHLDRDNTEKQIHFKTKDDTGTYQHKCKIYGGNAESPIGIGVYAYEGEDGSEVKRVWAYDDQKKHLVSDVPLASYPLEITLGDGASSVDNRSICQQLTRAARLHAKFTSKAISANETMTLGKISTDYVPKGFDVILSAYTDTTVCDVFLTAKGYIKIKAPNAIAAGKSIFLDGSWIY